MIGMICIFTHVVKTHQKTLKPTLVLYLSRDSLYWHDSVLVRLLKIFITVLVVNFIFLYFITYSIFICEEPLSFLVEIISISDHCGRRRGRGHDHSPIRMNESHMAQKKIQVDRYSILMTSDFDKIRWELRAIMFSHRSLVCDPL